MVNKGLRPVVCEHVLLKGREFVEEERAARHISINILLYRPGNAGTADNEHRTRPEVFEAVNAEADVLDGLYKTVITLTDRIGIAVPPRIVDVLLFLLF